MKVATILPTAYLEMIRDDDYHMCLAHLIGNDPVYTDFYKQIGKEDGKYLIMDNGVIEGDCRPIDEIVRKALSVQADEIILPDVFRDTEATLKSSYDALRYVRGNFPLRVMVVPQGNSLDEWLGCALAMIDWDIDCIGIPKVLVHLAGRDGRLEALKMLGNRLRGLDIHLLGCWTTPLEITTISRAVYDKHILPVRGVDSAIPYMYTKKGILLCDDDKPHITVDFQDTRVDYSLLERNVRLWKESPDIETFDIPKIF